MGLSINAEPDTDWLRYSYTSLTTPGTTYELNTRTGERKLLKREPVPTATTRRSTSPSGCGRPRATAPRCRCRWSTARASRRTARAALLQYAYGSYGASSDPGFSQTVVSLLDRGMVYAIAHIRGGQEMGRAWYDDGKLLNKKNTFTDFIDVTDFLVKRRLCRARTGSPRTAAAPAAC